MFNLVTHLYHTWYKARKGIGYRGHLYIDLQRFTRIDTKTTGRQMEDLPRDMECYKDSDNNRYDFAYGLNWSGQIDDNRVKKYR